MFVEAGRMTHRSDRNSAAQDKGAFLGENDKVTYLGGTYQFSPALITSLYTSKADDLWRRHNLGINHTAELGNGMALNTDLSHYHTSDRSDGSDLGNKATSLALTLTSGYHAITGAYQRMSGDSGYEYFDGAWYLANSVQYLDFNAKDERSWHAAYQYDFAGAGIPGLGFTARYIRGSNIDTDAYAGATSDTRWERDFALDYTIQQGALAGLNLKWMNATVRQDRNIDGGDVDENRVVASYTWNLL
ncbi:MAG: outer membrane porin, OprD family [Pseudomonadaceae bacterium]|nr:MAG: outer membrane porin, OprD family [Pseudomonadaceae bacterium]